MSKYGEICLEKKNTPITIYTASTSDSPTSNTATPKSYNYGAYTPIDNRASMTDIICRGTVLFYESVELSNHPHIIIQDTYIDTQSVVAALQVTSKPIFVDMIPIHTRDGISFINPHKIVYINIRDVYKRGNIIGMIRNTDILDMIVSIALSKISANRATRDITHRNYINYVVEFYEMCREKNIQNVSGHVTFGAMPYQKFSSDSCLHITGMTEEESRRTRFSTNTNTQAVNKTVLNDNPSSYVNIDTPDTTNIVIDMSDHNIVKNAEDLIKSGQLKFPRASNRPSSKLNICQKTNMSMSEIMILLYICKKFGLSKASNLYNVAYHTLYSRKTIIENYIDVTYQE